MSKKRPKRAPLLRFFLDSRWLLLLWLLLVIASAYLRLYPRLRGYETVLAFGAGCAALGTVSYFLVKLAIAVRQRRLWIEDRRARGLRTYEQPRDAISRNEIVRRILFLPKPPPVQP